MKKTDRILKLFCNYIIDNKVKLNDPEEDDYGQCVSEVSLAEMLKGTNIDVKKVTVEELSCLLLNNFSVCKDNKPDYRGYSEEEKEYERPRNYYGEIFGTNVQVYWNDAIIQIWDGY